MVVIPSTMSYSKSAQITSTYNIHLTYTINGTDKKGVVKHYRSNDVTPNHVSIVSFHNFSATFNSSIETKKPLTYLLTDPENQLIQVTFSDVSTTSVTVTTNNTPSTFEIISECNTSQCSSTPYLYVPARILPFNFGYINELPVDSVLTNDQQDLVITYSIYGHPIFNLFNMLNCEIDSLNTPVGPLQTFKIICSFYDINSNFSKATIWLSTESPFHLIKYDGPDFDGQPLQLELESIQSI